MAVRAKEDRIGILVTNYRCGKKGSRDALLEAIQAEARAVVGRLLLFHFEEREDAVSEIVLWFAEDLDRFAKKTDLKRSPTGMLRRMIANRFLTFCEHIDDGRVDHDVLVEYMERRDLEPPPERVVEMRDLQEFFLARLMQRVRVFRFPEYRTAFARWVDKIATTGKEGVPPLALGTHPVPLVVRDAMRVALHLQLGRSGVRKILDG